MSSARPDVRKALKRGAVWCYLHARAGLRAFYLRTRFLGRSVYVHRTAWISPRSVVRVRGGGTVRIGRNCEIHPFSMLLTYGEDIEIGDHCSINPFTIVYGGVRIGNGVRMAAHSVIVTINHEPGTDESHLFFSGISRRAITIEDNVWIGAGSRILAGVHIARNSIIGAGSVVTKSVPANATAAGVPARVIRQR